MRGHESMYLTNRNASKVAIRERPSSKALQPVKNLEEIETSLSTTGRVGTSSVPIVVHKCGNTWILWGLHPNKQSVGRRNLGITGTGWPDDATNGPDKPFGQTVRSNRSFLTARTL